MKNNGHVTIPPKSKKTGEFTKKRLKALQSELFALAQDITQDTIDSNPNLDMAAMAGLTETVSIGMTLMMEDIDLPQPLQLQVICILGTIFIEGQLRGMR